MMQRRVGEKYSKELVERRDFSWNSSRVFARQKHDWTLRVDKQVAVPSIEFAESLGRFQIRNHYGEWLFNTVFALPKSLNRFYVGRVNRQMKSAQPFDS